MRYYIEINGVSSLSLAGFAIKELPPISKPLMRNIKEEIDGRDGDIITKLGYSAYDKQIEVGLYGEGYDINKIIAFFNSEGEIVFSNEPDKIYNFTILNQIDFEKLLRFKTATITFHCQPFKYKKNEEPIEIEYQYVEREGTNITLDNTDEKPMTLDLKGNTSQQTYTGKQLFNIETISSSNRQYIRNNGFILTKGTNRTINFNLPNSIPAGTYTLSVKVVNSTLSSNSKFMINFNGSGSIVLGNIEILNNPTFTITSPVDNLYFFITSNESDGVTITVDDIMLNAGNTARPYEPYVGGNTSPNPDYPQRVNVVSGSNQLKIIGKNLLQIKEDTNLRNCTYVSGANTNEYKLLCTAGDMYVNDITVEGNAYSNIRGNLIDCVYGEKIYFNTGNTLGIKNFITEYDENLISLGYASIYTMSGNYTIRNQNCKYITFRFGIGFSTSVVGTTYVFAPIVCKIDDTSYESYTEDIYYIDLPVENKFDLENGEKGGIDSSGALITTNDNWRAVNYISVDSNSTYTFSVDSSNLSTSYILRVYEYDSNYNFISPRIVGNNNYPLTFTTSQNTKYIKYTIYISASNLTQEIIDGITPQIEPGFKVNKYTPSGITPIEMYKTINSDYIDVFQYDKDNNKWYKNAQIEKIRLNGNENFELWANATNKFSCKLSNVTNLIKISSSSQLDVLISNYFTKAVSQDALYSNDIEGIATTQGNLYFKINEDIVTDLVGFKTWLTTHITEVIYVLETPTSTEITYQPLIEQLNLLLDAISKKTQTNIIQSNNDMPFIIKATAFELGSDQAVINNEGNIYSKPILNIVGEDTINVTLNDNQLFNVDLSEYNEITIDPNILEAYNPNTSNLMNRKVIGDIANLKFPEGNNTMKIEGKLTKATIKRYSRWL